MFVMPQRGKKHKKVTIITVKETKTASVSGQMPVSGQPTSLKHVHQKHDMALSKRIPEKT